MTTGITMTTRKRIGTLPPLSDCARKEPKPLPFIPKNENRILGHSVRLGAPKTVSNGILSLPDISGCLESDYDFEEASSPAASSTASGPIYERPAGFEFHAQSIRVDKPKNKKVKGTKLASLGSKDGGKKKEASCAKGKSKKVSVPMKERQFPMSFWKEPNNINPVLPPIASHHPDEVDLNLNVENLSIDPDKISPQESEIPKRRVIVSNKSDQLTLKLFDCINNDTKLAKRKSGKTDYVEYSRPGLSGRGDPYLLENILEKLPSSLSSVSQQQILQMIPFERTRGLPVLVPTLAVKNNYSQMLCEIVERLG